MTMGQHGTPHPPAALPVTQPINSPFPFQFSDISVETVEDILSEVGRAGKSTGPGGIPPRLLSMVAPLLAEPITHLINTSFRAGVFPDMFKLAHVVPIPKTTSAQQPDDFRPISLLNNVSKVFEKDAQRQLLVHLKRYSVIVATVWFPRWSFV